VSVNESLVWGHLNLICAEIFKRIFHSCNGCSGHPFRKFRPWALLIIAGITRRFGFGHCCLQLNPHFRRKLILVFSCCLKRLSLGTCCHSERLVVVTSEGVITVDQGSHDNVRVHPLADSLALFWWVAFEHGWFFCIAHAFSVIFFNTVVSSLTGNLVLDRERDINVGLFIHYLFDLNLSAILSPEFNGIGFAGVVLSSEFAYNRLGLANQGPLKFYKMVYCLTLFYAFSASADHVRVPFGVGSICRVVSLRSHRGSECFFSKFERPYFVFHLSYVRVGETLLGSEAGFVSLHLRESYGRGLVRHVHSFFVCYLGLFRDVLSSRELKSEPLKDWCVHVAGFTHNVGTGEGAHGWGVKTRNFLTNLHLERGISSDNSILVFRVRSSNQHSIFDTVTEVGHLSLSGRETGLGGLSSLHSTRYVLWSGFGAGHHRILGSWHLCLHWGLEYLLHRILYSLFCGIDCLFCDSDSPHAIVGETAGKLSSFTNLVETSFVFDIAILIGNEVLEESMSRATNIVGGLIFVHLLELFNSELISACVFLIEQSNNLEERVCFLLSWCLLADVFLIEQSDNLERLFSLSWCLLAESYSQNCFPHNLRLVDLNF